MAINFMQQDLVNLVDENTTNTIPELRSIIANPQLTDPSIDVSNLRTTTPTRSELLAAVPEFSGLKFDPTQRSYIEDLYSLYSGGLPTIDVAQDTAQIPGAIDTLVNPNNDGFSDDTLPGFDVDGPKNTYFEQNLIDQGIGVQASPGDPVGAAFEEQLTQEAIDDLANYPVTQPMTGGITGDPIEVGIPDNESGFVDPLGTIGGPPDIFDINVVGDPALNPGSTMVQGDDPYGTREQQNLISQAFSKVGSTANDIMRDLSEIPGAVADFVGKTVDIAGQKINVGKTLLSAGINKIVGGPISLVFDLLPKDSLENTTTRSIVDELKASGKNYGFNMQSGNLNQDPFGRNPVSTFGNYEETLINDINNPSNTKMGNAKKQFAQDYFNAKAEKASGAVTEPGTVVGPGEFPSTQDDFDTTNEAAVNVGTPSFDGFDSGGFDPAPAPAAPAPAPSIPDRGRGDRGGGGGGGGGSPGSAGPGGSDEMGSF